MERAGTMASVLPQHVAEEGVARPLLEIRHAMKRFITPEGQDVVALDDVSISVARNEFLTLLGPSGCGKTTLLRVVSGFEDLDAGEICIDGQNIAGQPAYRRPVNTVFQTYALFPHLTVARNVAYSLEVARAGKEEIRRRVGEMLELVGLGGFGERRINQLSGGQQQRVALARALAPSPAMLLLDEPLSNLDANLRETLTGELASLLAMPGLSAVHVTHDQAEAFRLADVIAILKAGRVVQSGPARAVFEAPRNPWVARFLGYRNVFTDRDQPVLLDDGQVRLGSSGSGPGATVTESVPHGTGLELNLAVDGWQDNFRWSGHARELGPSPVPGDRLQLDIPQSAWIPLEADEA